MERSFSPYNEIFDDKRRSLDHSTIRAFHFLNWNLCIKSSIEEEREKQNNYTKGPRVIKETLKTVPEKKPPLLGKASDNGQQPGPVPAPKASKRKIDVAEEKRNVSKVCIRTNVAHQAGVYPSFRSMKRLGVFLLPPGWDASPSQGYPPALSSLVPIYTPGWREAL